MTTAPKRIGVMTGGGDCPGLNAAIRAVTKSAIFGYGIEVFGIEDGFLGLIENRVKRLHPSDVSNLLTVGGTMLGTSNKANPAKFAVGWTPDGDPDFRDVTDDCMRHIEQHALDALVVIGGDGTMTVAEPFVERGVSIVGVPKTIDNDLIGSELTIGFDTAVNVATHALDRLHTTASSHHRVMVIEVMGRNAGWIALHAGAASGSDVIVIPEIPYELKSITDFVKKRNQQGKRFSLVCVAEGAKAKGGQQTVSRIDPTSPDPIRLGGIGDRLADDIARVTDVDTRATVLGHVLRGGTPTATDRVLATNLGYHAVELLMQGHSRRLCIWQDGKISDIDLTEASGKQRLVNPATDPLVAASRAVGTNFGD